MRGTIFMILLWGVVFLWIGSALLKIAYLTDPSRRARPRMTDGRWIMRELRKLRGAGARARKRQSGVL
jgi:hypothetical protein